MKSVGWLFVILCELVVRSVASVTISYHFFCPPSGAPSRRIKCHRNSAGKIEGIALPIS